MRRVKLPQYLLAWRNLHIVDSYKVRKWNMRPILEQIRLDAAPGQTLVFIRSLFSLKMEWIAHNFLYNIGYKRDRTGSVDLDYPCDRPEWLYCLCGILVWLFVW